LPKHLGEFGEHNWGLIAKALTIWYYRDRYTKEKKKAEIYGLNDLRTMYESVSHSPASFEVGRERKYSHPSNPKTHPQETPVGIFEPNLVLKVQSEDWNFEPEEEISSFRYPYIPQN
jgi:hypothetical protein